MDDRNIVLKNCQVNGGGKGEKETRSKKRGPLR